MTDSLLDSATHSLAAREAFQETDEGFLVTTTPFEATIRVDSADGSVAYRIDVTVPTLDAVVADETVAPVVQEGWFETFERRIKSLGTVTRTEPDPPWIRCDNEAAVIHVTFTFESSLPARGTEDAKALVDFVEGTYVQGIIPGYEYDSPVAELLNQATDRSQSAGEPPL